MKIAQCDSGNRIYLPFARDLKAEHRNLFIQLCKCLSRKVRNKSVAGGNSSKRRQEEKVLGSACEITIKKLIVYKFHTRYGSYNELYTGRWGTWEDENVYIYINNVFGRITFSCPVQKRELTPSLHW